MNIFHHLKKWYFDTFLPFENPNHPLYSDGTIPMDEFSQEIADFIDDELANMEDMIGPNYGWQMGHKPAEYEKWGNKWYKKT